MDVPFDRKAAQIAIVVRDIEASSRRFAGLFGVDVPEIRVNQPGNERGLIYRGKPTNDQAKLAFFDLGNIQLELLEPIGTDNAWAEGLDEKGERLHHIAFFTESMADTKAHFEKHGAPMVMNAGTLAHFDGQDLFGCFIEVFERRGG